MEVTHAKTILRHEYNTNNVAWPHSKHSSFGTNFQTGFPRLIIGYLWKDNESNVIILIVEILPKCLPSGNYYVYVCLFTQCLL